MVTLLYETEIIELRKADLKAAVNALWLIGKHAAIQAFSKKVKHAHRLAQRLAAKSKAVEKAATERKLELVE